MVESKKNKDANPVADSDDKSLKTVADGAKAVREVAVVDTEKKDTAPAASSTETDIVEEILKQQNRPPKHQNTDIIDDGSDDDQQSQNLFQILFANGNKIITVEDGPVSVDSETRHMLALFSDGTYIVDEAHRYDGKVLNFVATMKRRKIPISNPRYYSAAEISAIYAYAERGMGQINISAEETSDYQMQIDFLSVVSRAAVHKVSDIHVVVADSTLILFRINGMMERELEYSKEWGESFVRAAFASADISDANYAKNEFQGAQKLGSTPLRGTNGKLRLPHNILAIRLQFNPIAFG